MDGHIMRCGTTGSCQSAATSEIVKRCWSRVLTHVSGAIASVQTFTFTFMLYLQLHTNAAYRLVLPLWSSVVLIPIIIKRLTLR